MDAAAKISFFAVIGKKTARFWVKMIGIMPMELTKQRNELLPLLMNGQASIKM